MANKIILGFVTVVCLMATANSAAEDNDVLKCEYKNSEEECRLFGECLAEYEVPVENPCDDEEIEKLQISNETWKKIDICSWKQLKILKEDNTCDYYKIFEIVDTRLIFDNDETKKSVIASINNCKEEHEPDCIAVLYCGAEKGTEICTSGFNI